MSGVSPAPFRRDGAPPRRNGANESTGTRREVPPESGPSSSPGRWPDQGPWTRGRPGSGRWYRLHKYPATMRSAQGVGLGVPVRGGEQSRFAATIGCVTQTTSTGQEDPTARVNASHPVWMKRPGPVPKDTNSHPPFKRCSTDRRMLSARYRTSTGRFPAAPRGRTGNSSRSVPQPFASPGTAPTPAGCRNRTRPSRSLIATPARGGDGDGPAPSAPPVLSTTGGRHVHRFGR